MREFDLIKNPVASLVRDLRRAITNKKYEFDGPLMVVRDDVNVTIGGVFDSWVMRPEIVQDAVERQDIERERAIRAYARTMPGFADMAGCVRLHDSSDHNLIPDLGINFILNLIFRNDRSKINTWYHGLFTSSSTPAVDWGSNWAGTGSGPEATELPNADYDETNRQAATFATNASSKSITASTPTLFTMANDPGSPVTIYGSTLNEISTVAYNATDKILLAAARFSSAKSGLSDGDKVNIEYTISGTSS